MQEIAPTPERMRKGDIRKNRGKITAHSEPLYKRMNIPEDAQHSLGYFDILRLCFLQRHDGIKSRWLNERVDYEFRDETVLTLADKYERIIRIMHNTTAYPMNRAHTAALKGVLEFEIPIADANGNRKLIQYIRKYTRSKEFRGNDAKAILLEAIAAFEDAVKKLSIDKKQ